MKTSIFKFCNILYSLSLVLFVLNFDSCSDSEHFSMADVSGLYIGKYGGGKETIYLSSKGLFNQVVVTENNITYKNEGRWEWDSKNKQIIFTHFAESLNSSSGKLYDQPEILTHAVYDWEPHPGEIIFYIDNNYYLIRAY